MRDEVGEKQASLPNVTMYVCAAGHIRDYAIPTPLEAGFDLPGTRYVKACRMCRADIVKEVEYAPCR